MVLQEFHLTFEFFEGWHQKAWQVEFTPQKQMCGNLNSYHFIIALRAFGMVLVEIFTKKDPFFELTPFQVSPYRTTRLY
jgi:hypothetical protein